jgi:lipoate-protein ligase A
MKYLLNPSTDPHYNMSFDEYCLERFPSDDTVFYLWRNAPSVIIGLNQNAYAEVNLAYLEAEGIKLARRVTGGGAVYHDLQNLNYTIVGRSRDLDRDYPGYLRYMLEALQELGVPAEMTGRNDLVVEGRKVSGYAKRVYKDRLMVHGTLMYDVDIARLTSALSVPGSKLDAAGIASVRSRVANLKDHLPQFSCIGEFQDALESILSRGHSDPLVQLSPEDEGYVSELSRTKFSTWEWNYGHSPKARFRKALRLPCGKVEAMCDIAGGRIAGLAFGGDFIGSLPAEGIAAALEGCRFERSAVLAVLSGLDAGLYFDSTSPEQLSNLFSL